MPVASRVNLRENSVILKSYIKEEVIPYDSRDRCPFYKGNSYNSNDRRPHYTDNSSSSLVLVSLT